MPFVTGKITYKTAPLDGSPPVTFVGKMDPLTGEFQTNSPSNNVSAQIEDIRGKESLYTLDTSGFQYGHHASRVKSFNDNEEIKTVYYPECIEIIQAATGAKRIVIFDDSKLYIVMSPR
jgi:hypothetical protein